MKPDARWMILWCWLAAVTPGLHSRGMAAEPQGDVQGQNQSRPREAESGSATTKPEARSHAPARPVSALGTDEARLHDDTFRKLVTNVRLSGHFTMDGQAQEDAKLRREEYVITGATKLGNGDAWLLTSRITYGDVDLTVPVPVQVKWAGTTPVITLDNVGIPGLGTFSARVVLDDGRYAGTWSHDKVGGHMFGRIVPAVADAKDATRSGSQPAATAPAKSPPPAR